jgi:phasin
MEAKMPNLQVPEEARSFAEKSVEEARTAFHGFLAAAQKAADAADGSGQTVRANSQEMTRKGLNCAERNMSAAFDHAKRLVRAKDSQEAFLIQTEFVKSQFFALQAQTRDFVAGVEEATTQPVGKKA